MRSTEVKIQSGPANINIRRLFDSQPTNSRQPKPTEIPPSQPAVHHIQNLKQIIEEKPDKTHKQSVTQKHKPPTNTKEHASQRTRKVTVEQRPESAESCHRVFSADSHRMSRQEMAKKTSIKKQQKTDENLPPDQQQKQRKGWIRPRSASQTNKKTKTVKKTDPVSLYQSYQKDWQKFRTNICESSHSDLRWSIRERMANKQ